MKIFEVVSLAEISYADALGDLSISDSDIIATANLDGTIGQAPVMLFSKGANRIFFFSSNDKISALVLLHGNNIKAIKNFTKEKGAVLSLLNYIVNIKHTSLVIASDEPLTDEGFSWIARLIKAPTGIRISDPNGDPVNIETLTAEWKKSKATGGDWAGPTSITISESSKEWQTKLQTNETSLMPYIYFKTRS